MKTAPRDLIAAAKKALGAIARLDQDGDQFEVYSDLCKALEGVRPDDEPVFRQTCPTFLLEALNEGDGVYRP